MNPYRMFLVMSLSGVLMASCGGGGGGGTTAAATTPTPPIVFSTSVQTLSAACFALALGDIDGDGDLDLVAGNYAAANTVWLNDGSGVFTNSGQTLGAGNTMSVALGDIDGDGDLDLVEGNGGDQANIVWLNDGSGAFTNSGQPLGAGNTSAVVLGDINDDGYLDLLEGNYQEASIVWLNDGDGDDDGYGDGTFTDSGQALSHSTGIIWSKTSSLAFGDIDGDGDLDLVEGYANSSPNKVWENDGVNSGIFSDTAQALGAAFTKSVSLGDIDGDGDLDLVTANLYEVGNAVWENDGTGVFTDSGQALGATDTHSVALGDLDGDGDLDMAEGIYESPADKIWVNDGLNSGIFSDTGQALSTTLTHAVVLGDLDGDGDLDLASGRYGSSISVYMNLTE